MGNCLKSNGGQQDNATLLSNSPDPAVTGTAPQEAMQPLSFNEVPGSYYPSRTNRPRYLQSMDLSVGDNLRVGVVMSPRNVGASGLLSEEEQKMRIAKRIGLIQHLPTREYDGTKKGECVICMMELTIGEAVRYLPCMHTYHATCIDDWLLRSLTCPSCMEPVDAALINSYHPTT
ncbi:RING finger protein 11 [Venturia canescens]|uniref:RING finger protein 11 n=1 Tax=Venturia canescens TaxID=32260 RepID=UPI001C9CC964|nr:RING finger protein 11 [Venturia canescens]